MIVDFAGFGSTTAQAVDVIRRGGTVVLVGMGKLNPAITTIGFNEIPEGIEKLKNGEVVGRLVAFYE